MLADGDMPMAGHVEVPAERVVLVQVLAS
jgi:hypothetical protein